MCKKNEEIVMPNFAALRAAVFPLSTKTSGGGGGYPPPVGARVKFLKVEVVRPNIVTLSPKMFLIISIPQFFP